MGSITSDMGNQMVTRVCVERFDDYTATLKIYFDMVRNWQPKNPIFLVGHSMGGLISAAYLLEHQNTLAGAVLSGPGIKVPDNISKVVILAGKILSVCNAQGRNHSIRCERHL